MSGCFFLKSATFSASLCCGISEPGMAARDSMKSRISAIRIEVSCRHIQRSVPATPSAGTESRVSAGAVDSCAPAAPRPSSRSASSPEPGTAACAGTVPDASARSPSPRPGCCVMLIAFRPLG